MERWFEQVGALIWGFPLMIALSATVGTGIMAGIVTAIAAGGPGAMFWMWITYSGFVISLK